jgi:hypothetical protein
MDYPDETLKLAAALLGSYDLEHAVMTLRLQGSLFGGCCGMVGPNYDYARALSALAAELEACAGRDAARARRAHLAGAARP